MRVSTRVRPEECRRRECRYERRPNDLLGTNLHKYSPSRAAFPLTNASSPRRLVDNSRSVTQVPSPQRDARGPDRPGSGMPVPITDSEIAERVAGWTVPRSFLATTRARPDAVALRWKDGDAGRSLTFGEYADQAARVAAGLGQLGVVRGTRVVMLLRNCPEFHVADVATLFAGGTPISIYNSSSPDQIEFLA